jgi:hypothetical protein
MNTQAIAAALRALADAIDTPECQSTLPAQVVTTAAPVVSPEKKPRKQKAVAAATETAAPAAAPAQAIPATGDSKVYTESDVRTALTQAQTRLGGKEKPFEILGKYSTNKVISGLAAADYAKVIAECASAA